MVQFFIAVLGALRVFFCSRSDTALEILALRQQVAVLKRNRSRPPLHSGDRFFWTTSAAYGPAGPMSSSLSNQRPSLAGIAPAFGFIGAGGLVRAAGDRVPVALIRLPPFFQS